MIDTARHNALMKGFERSQKPIPASTVRQIRNEDKLLTGKRPGDAATADGKKPRLMFRAAFVPVLSAYGRVVDEADKKYTLLYEFDYGKGATKIKIEFNKRVWKNNRYKNEWFMGVPILLADEMTVATNKLVALSDRKSAVVRDLFDAWYFLSHGFKLNEQLLIERTGKGVGEYCAFLVRFIKKTFSRRNVLQGLGEALDDKQKVWAREHLIDETVSLLEKMSGINSQPSKVP